jgi:hypothetical protein
MLYSLQTLFRRGFSYAKQTVKIRLKKGSCVQYSGFLNPFPEQGILVKQE